MAVTIKKIAELCGVSRGTVDRVLNGRGKVRLQGGGFAGNIQAIVPDDLLDAYKAAIDACFGEGSCHVLNIRNYGAVPVTPDM